MQAVEKFDTLMTRTYQLEYKPTADPINPYIQVVEHKTRPRLEEVHLRNRYRRTLSALLRSKPVPGTFDKTHAAFNTLHKYENGLQGKVSLAAPTKEHQKYASLRQGRDPRMNEPNAHFDMLGKENQGFNVGRHQGEKPTSATLAWRPLNPFLTYEKPTLTDAQLHELTSKQIHSKVMNNRVQIYNQQFVPEDLLPSECGWKKETKQRAVKKRSNSLEYPSLGKNQHCIAHDHSKEQKFKVDQQKVKASTRVVQNAASERGQSPANTQIIDVQQQEVEKQDDQVGQKEGEEEIDLMPAQILEEMRKSNIKDIIRNMTVHEQLRMLRSVIDDEEFKRREKIRSDRESRQLSSQAPEESEKVAIKPKINNEFIKQSKRRSMNLDLEDYDCTCNKKRLDDMTYEELANQKPSDQAEEGPLPLTEFNLSAMNSDRRSWNVVGANRPSEGQTRGHSPDSHEIPKKQKQIQFKNTIIDLGKVNEKKKSDRLLSQGWSQPEQMDSEEIQRRQNASESEGSNRVLAKRVFEIVQRNNLVPMPIPPVPRMVMGNHGQQV